MYLESYLAAPASDPNALPAPSDGNGTKRRLTVIEITMMTGVIISAVSLVFNIYNTVKKAGS